MSGMILYLDELSEDGRPETRRFEVPASDMKSLLEGADYDVVADLTAEFEADRVDSTVRIVGSFQTAVEYQCGRCLETRQRELGIETEFVLMDRATWQKTYDEHEEIELDPDDMDVSFYEGDEIDLAPLIREAILLELPTLLRCPPEARDDCDAAYERNIGDEALEKLEEAAVDQRWAPLKDIKLKD